MTRSSRRSAGDSLAALFATGPSNASDAHGAGAVGPILEVAVRDWPRDHRGRRRGRGGPADDAGRPGRRKHRRARRKGRRQSCARGRCSRGSTRGPPTRPLLASRSQVAEAQANLANAKRKYERNRDLLAQKFVSQAALDQAEAEYKAAQAQVAAMTANAGQAVAAQSYTTIAAPYAGVIGATLAELGDMAQPGRPLVTIFDPHELRVAATVPQAALPRSSSTRRSPSRFRRSTRRLRDEGDRHPACRSRTHTARDPARSARRRKSAAGSVRARSDSSTGTTRTLAVPQPRCSGAARSRRSMSSIATGGRSSARSAWARPSATTRSKFSQDFRRASGSRQIRCRRAWRPPSRPCAADPPASRAR